MVGDHEAAGAIPAIQTTMPPLQGWDTRLRISSAEVQFLTVVRTQYLDVAQQQSMWVTTTRSLVQSQSSRPTLEFVDVAQKESAWVTTTMSLVQSQSSTRIDPFSHAIVPRTGHDAAKVVG